MALLEGRREAVRRPLRAAPRWDRRALACCVLAVLVLAGGLGLALSRSEQHRSGTNGVFSQAQVVAPAGATACQGRELLPAGTVEVQIAGVSEAPPVVVLRHDGRVLDRVVATVDQRAGVIRAPIERTEQARDDVRVCLVLGGASVLARGITPPGVGTAVVERAWPGSSLAIRYLMSGSRSWWAFAATAAERISGGHAHSGIAWVVWAAAGLLAASLALTGLIVLRTLVRDQPMPRLGVAIALVAVLNAAAWSFVTPAFQVPDEVAHVAYVQSLGETGRPPAHPPALLLSREQATAMEETGFGGASGQNLAVTYRAAAWSRAQEHRLAADLERPLSRRQTIAAGEAEPEPPLYYALEAIPYRLAHHANLLDRIMLMRLVSTLLAGATALLSFLFVKECLPAKPWAWAVGGLGVALVPMLGFIAGGVNPDALLFALSAGLFLCVARAWRRGLTMRLALVAGPLIGAGMLTKVNFYGLVLGALLGLALAARRTTLAWDRRALGMVGGAALLGGGLFAAGAVFEAVVWQRSVFAARPIAPESHVGLWSHFGYVWQVFLPRLPFQPQTALVEPGYQQLFESFIGAFGQLIVRFPTWVYQLFAVGLALVGLLVVRVLHADPRELRWRRGELLSYVAMALPLLLLIGLSADLRRHLVALVQGRYLLPLLPLFGAMLALGARGAGERWGRTVGVAIVMGAVAWSLFGQLLTIAWFYG
ncbi:MAG TPA: DUF2142 domain-containing protein [Conexibacter sp.]|jgi:hypothetical protein|nr:DUF2142 domain-containing protein [Conexibacter sp.]